MNQKKRKRGKGEKRLIEAYSDARDKPIPTGIRDLRAKGLQGNSLV